MARWYTTAGLLLILCFGAGPSAARQAPAGRDTARVLLPVCKTSLGGVLSNTLPVSMMRALLDSALVARDAHGRVRRVVAFNFGFQEFHVVPNDTTGRPETRSAYTAWSFRGNRLDSLWRDRLKQRLQKGDRLYFDRVIAEDAAGVKYLSSSLEFRLN